MILSAYERHRRPDLEIKIDQLTITDMQERGASEFLRYSYQSHKFLHMCEW